MLEELLPPSVAVAESFGDPSRAPLLGAESKIVAGAVGKRRREFATVRWCARRALADLDIAPIPILTGEGGAPAWPDGVVGSMTHCDGYRAAAVAHAGEVRGVGIDAEPHLPLPEGVFASIALPAEQRRDAELRRLAPSIHWDRLLFCMKECVYKAWFPLTRRWLDFTQADVTVEYDGTFFARILDHDPAVPGDGFTGRWQVGHGVAVAAIAVVC